MDAGHLGLKNQLRLRGQHHRGDGFSVKGFLRVSKDAEAVFQKWPRSHLLLAARLGGVRVFQAVLILKV